MDYLMAGQEDQSLLMPKRRAMMGFSSQGLLLLSMTSMVCPQPFQLSEDDLTLVVDYALWLWDHSRYKIGCDGTHWNGLRMLVITLAGQVIDRIDNRHGALASSEGPQQESSHRPRELCQYLDLLLDVLRDDLIATVRGVSHHSTLALVVHTYTDV